MEYVVIRDISEGRGDSITFDTSDLLLAYLQENVDEGVDIDTWNVYTIGSYIPIDVVSTVLFGEE